MSTSTDTDNMVQGDTTNTDQSVQKEAVKSNVLQKNGVDEPSKDKPVNGLSNHGEDNGDDKQSSAGSEATVKAVPSPDDQAEKVESANNMQELNTDTSCRDSEARNLDEPIEDKKSTDDNCENNRSQSPNESKSASNGQEDANDTAPSQTDENSVNQKDNSDEGESDKDKNGLVDTVKDGDGDEILITINKDDEAMDCDPPVQTSPNTDANGDKAASEKAVSLSTATTAVTMPAQVSLPPPPLVAAVPNTAISTALQSTTMSSTFVNLPLTSLPPGAQFAQQGNKLGYITKVGYQTVFVPLNVSTVGGTTPASSALINQLAKQQTQSSQPTKVPAAQPRQQASATTLPAMTADDLKPKNSWEMMELMKWEVQNRISDSWNWSVAFHPKKEELSSVTSFLLETGSDMVKEQVYKDIIQIQTKKKDAGELKDSEIESLGKMKTVYENTKKKVEHLQLKVLSCKMCDFKTESKLILSHHKDYPHYDPPWDTNRGILLCSLCNFRTKVHVQFIFHMQDVHSRQAKLPDKQLGFQCSLCPLNATSKAKLEKHQGKCMKHFKLNINLQPYYHDVNFCMKQCYYKPKKPVVKPPPPPPVVKPSAPKPSPTMHTRQQGTISQPQLLPQAHRTVRPTVPSATKPAILQTRPTAPVAQPQTLAAGNIRLQLAASANKPKPPSKEMSGFEVCEMCGGYVKDRQALRIHFYYAHKVELPITIFQRPNPPLSCEVCKSQFWTMQGLTKHKATMQHYPPKKNPQPQQAPTQVGNLGMQQCFMCARKVGNLFIHFEQTHGVTMKDMVLMKKCIICGITAADRRSLEVHLATVHGVRIKTTDYIADKPAAPVAAKQPVSSGPKQGKNIGKINFCVFCEIQFSDNIQLTMHCMRKHATCRTCGMVVKVASLLETHSCMKANRICNICGLENMTLDSYATHLKKHVKPCKVIVENLNEAQIVKAKEKVKREYKPAVISLDSDDDDSDVEVVETKPSKMKCVLEKDSKGVEHESEPVSVDEENENNETTANKGISADEDNTKPVNDSEAASSDAVKMDVDSDTKENSKDDISNESSVDSDSKKNANTEDTVDKSVEQSDNSDNTKTKHESEDSSEKNLGIKIESVQSLNEEASKSKGTKECVDDKDSDKIDEVMDEDELLGMKEDTNDSTDSAKRKRNDSDIDEDELLRDESDTKKPKLEPENELNEPNDINGPKDDTEKVDEMRTEDISGS